MPADPLGYLPPHWGYQYKQCSLSPVAAPPLRKPCARHAEAAFALDAVATKAVGLGPWTTKGCTTTLGAPTATRLCARRT